MSNRITSSMGKAFSLFFLLALAGSIYAIGLHKISIDTIEREFMLYSPPQIAEATPVVFAYHGHGGTMKTAAAKFHFETVWPEAIVVYPQGLPTPIGSDPKGEKPGWQLNLGDQKDRDIKLFDAIIEYLRQNYKIDENRIYITGFSDGGRMAYMLLAARGEKIAAIAPVAGILLDKDDFKHLMGKPIFHVVGKEDKVIKYSMQKSTIDYIKKLNKCDKNGKEINDRVTEYSSSAGTPVFTYIHTGGHEIPEDALLYILEFFKRFKN